MASSESLILHKLISDIALAKDSLARGDTSKTQAFLSLIGTGSKELLRSATLGDSSRKMGQLAVLTCMADALHLAVMEAPVLSSMVYYGVRSAVSLAICNIMMLTRFLQAFQTGTMFFTCSHRATSMAAIISSTPSI